MLIGNISFSKKGLLRISFSTVSVINLSEYKDKISCYVRCQLKGDGGICLTQPFICDDGNLSRFKKEIPAPKILTKKEERQKKFGDTRLGVIVNKLKDK